MPGLAAGAASRYFASCGRFAPAPELRKGVKPPGCLPGLSHRRSPGGAHRRNHSCFAISPARLMTLLHSQQRQGPACGAPAASDSALLPTATRDADASPDRAVGASSGPGGDAAANCAPAGGCTEQIRHASECTLARYCSCRQWQPLHQMQLKQFKAKEAETLASHGLPVHRTQSFEDVTSLPATTVVHSDART